MGISTYGSRILQRIGVSKDSDAYRRISRTYWGLKSVRGSRYYSQFGEDAALTSLLPHDSGFYVDVGAGHATQGSNTYSLYRKGWHGVLIEPIAENVAACRILRPRDRVVQALCGNENTSVPFYEFASWQLSTTSPDVVQRLSGEGHVPVRESTLPMVKLADLEISASPRSPSLLAVDVEGGEMGVLDGNDWETFLPAVVCIEQWDSPLVSSSPVSERLISLGYSLYNFVGNSGIWLHRDSRYGR